MRMHYTQVKMGLLSQIPLGDFGDPIDIAEVARFLASSRYIYLLEYFWNCWQHDVLLIGQNTYPVPPSMSMVD